MFKNLEGNAASDEVSISAVIEEEGNMTIPEIEEVNNESLKLELENALALEQSQSAVSIEPDIVKKKILIVGDEYAQNFAKVLEAILGKSQFVIFEEHIVQNTLNGIVEKRDAEFTSGKLDKSHQFTSLNSCDSFRIFAFLKLNRCKFDVKAGIFYIQEECLLGVLDDARQWVPVYFRLVKLQGHNHLGDN
ncbi:hypothetical protein JTB14_020145 [Gonioctena quinquepunctata]|nr:hypothetical protein JTB14_020145 [Gonioctena quinquepunctata]